MPKEVDHQQRREEIARAVWSLVARGGTREATVRAVAQQSGWSMGAVRYYFSTQAELLLFAAEVMRDRVVKRVRDIVCARPPGPERALELVEQLLPMDEDRLVEVRVWLACATGPEAAFDPLRAQMWLAERHICRVVIADVLGMPAPSDPAHHLPPGAEHHVDPLHALIDGLTLIGTVYLARVDALWLRARVRQHLDQLAIGYGGGTTTGDVGHTGRDGRW